MKDSFYFQHDYNAANDVKILYLRQQLGIEGYGIFWFVIEQLAQAGGRLPLKVIPVIAMQIQTTMDKVASVIKNYELFEIENEEFFSMRLIEQIEFRRQLSEDGRAGALKRWGDNPGYNRKKALKEARKIESHSSQEWEEMIKFFDYKCAKCGDEGVIKDHIIPLNQGGLDGINNIQPLCKKCNSSKGNDTTDYRPQEWFKNRGATGGATAKERKGKERKESISDLYFKDAADAFDTWKNDSFLIEELQRICNGWRVKPTEENIGNAMRQFLLLEFNTDRPKDDLKSHLKRWINKNAKQVTTY